MDFSALLENVNWVAVLVAWLVSMVWSFVWYSKGVVGGPWMKAVGVTEKALQKAYMSRVMPVVIPFSFVSAFVLALLLQGAEGWVDGLVDGAIIGAGVAASQVLVLYGFSLRPRNLMWIDGVWVIANFALMGLVVSLFV
jgi:hypothetical protein